MPVTFTEKDFDEEPKFSEADFEEEHKLPPVWLPTTPAEIAQEESVQRLMPSTPSRALAIPMDIAGRAAAAGASAGGEILFGDAAQAFYPLPAGVQLPSNLDRARQEISGPIVLGEAPLPAREVLGPGSPLPTVPRSIGRAGIGFTEGLPKLGAVIASGPLAYATAPAIYGATEQGFDPKQAAIAAALPMAGRVFGGTAGTLFKMLTKPEAVERVATALGMTPAGIVNTIKAISGTGGPAALLWAEGEREVAKLPADQQDEARLQLLENVVTQAALGPVGVKWEKGPNAIYAKGPQVLRDVQAQPGESTGQVPAETRSSQAGERGSPEAVVSEAQQKRLLLKAEAEKELERQRAIGNEGLIQIAEEKLNKVNDDIAKEEQAERDEIESQMHPDDRAELERQRLDAEISKLEHDPEVRGGQVYAGRNPDGSLRMEPAKLNEKKINRLRDLKAQREPEGDYTDAEYDVDANEVKDWAQNQFGVKLDIVPGTGELPGDQPFAAGEYGRPTATGIEFRSSRLRGKLSRMKPKNRQLFLKTLALHEIIHKYTDPAQAIAYLRSMNWIERNINYRIYTGRWTPAELRAAVPGVRNFSESNLGYEAIRRRLEKLMLNTTTENVDAALREGEAVPEAMRALGGEIPERVSVRSLDIIGNMLRGVRERFAGRPQHGGEDIIDAVQKKLDDVKAGIEQRLREPEAQEAAAFAKPKAETLSEPVKDFIGLMDKGKTTGGNKLSSAAGMQVRSIRDLEALADLRRRHEAKQNELYKKAGAEKDREKQLDHIVEANTLNPRVQLAREAIETATNVGSWSEAALGDRAIGPRPLDWRKNPEVADWLRKNGAKLGISLPEELKAEAPAAAFDPQQHQRNLDQREFDVLYNAWFTKLKPWQQDTIRNYASAVTSGEGIDTALSNLTVGLGKGRDLERAKRAVQLANKLHLPPEHPANKRFPEQPPPKLPAAFEKQRENEERKLKLTRAGAAADEQMLKHLRTLPATQLEQMLQQREKYLESRYRLGAGRLNPGADIRNRKAFENQIKLIRGEIERRGEQAGPAMFDKMSDEELWNKAVGKIGIKAPQLNLRQLETIKQNSGIAHAFVDDDGALVKMNIKPNGVRIMVFPADWNFGDKFGIAETIHDVGAKMWQYDPTMHRNVGQGTLRIPLNKHLDKELSLRAARELIWHYTREGGVPEWTGRIPPLDETSFSAAFGKPGDLPEQQKPKEGPLFVPGKKEEQPGLPVGEPVEPQLPKAPPPEPPPTPPMELPTGEAVEPFRTPVSSREIEDAATARVNDAVAKGEAPDFNKYLGELQGKYGGGMTKEKAFYPWMDAVMRSLLNAPGESLRRMLRDMHLVPDVAEAIEPGESHPRLWAIPDAAPTEAIERTIRQSTMWPNQEPLQRRPRRRVQEREQQAQQRRTAAIGAIFDRLSAEAGGRPKHERFRKQVGPEDIDTQFVVIEPSSEVMTKEGVPTGEFTPNEVETNRLFRRFTPEEAADAKEVGRLATGAGARPSAKVKRSLTLALVALRDKINNRIQLVSAYSHQRRGPVVTNPEGRGPDVRIDNKLLGRYEPIATMRIRQPVEGFRQTFNSPEEFARWFGAEGIEGTPGVPSSSLTGPLASVAREQAGIARPAPRPEPEIAGTLPSEAPPSETGRELTVPRFARKTVPREPLQLPETSEQLQPKQPPGPQMLSAEDQAKLTERVKAESDYSPTEIKRSMELEKRNIFITPGARGERVPSEQIGYQRFRKPTKRKQEPPAAAFDKYQDFADAYFEEMQKVFNILGSLPDQKKATALFDYFTDAYAKMKGDITTDALPEPWKSAFAQIKEHWDNVHKLGEENPEWTKLYVSKPNLIEGRPRIGPGLGPAAFDKYSDFKAAYEAEMREINASFDPNLLAKHQRRVWNALIWGTVKESQLSPQLKAVYDKILPRWQKIEQMARENPGWMKLLFAKAQSQLPPDVAAAIDKSGEFQPEKDRAREALLKALENTDEFKRTVATFRSTPTSILEGYLKQTEPQPNEMSEAGIALWKKSQQAIRDELDRRGEDSFPAARDKETPQDEWDYYAKRLKEPELLDHAIWFRFRDKAILAVPVGGSRKSGSLGIIETMNREEADAMANQLRDQPGFPDVRVVKKIPEFMEDRPGDEYMVEWGKPIQWDVGLQDVEIGGHYTKGLFGPEIEGGVRGRMPTQEDWHVRLGKQFGYQHGYGVDFPTDPMPWPMPGEPFQQQGLFGQTYPQAFDKTLAMMREGVERVRDTALDMWRTGALEDRMAQGLDQIGNRKNNEAHQAELPIRMASMRKPTNIESLKFWKQHWTQGNREVLHAANAVVESEFNQGKLQDFRDQLDIAEQNARLMAQSTSWRTRQNSKAYLRDIAASRAEVEYADAHWNDPALQLTARRVKRTLDRQVRLEQAMGIDIRRQAGYVPHRLVDIWGEDTLFSLPGVLGTKFQAPRSFKTHYDALAAGPYMRITHDIASLVHHRVRQGLGKIYRDQWKASLLDIDMPNGMKLAMEPVQLANGNIRAPNNNYKLVPTENFGYLAIHKDAADMMRNLLSPSWVESSPKVRALLHMEQKLKHSLLIGDFFHFARMVYYGTSVLGRQALKMPANIGKYGWSALDIAPGDVQEAVRKGVITQREADWANETVRNTGMTRRELIERAYREHGANLGRITDALYKDLLTDLTPTAGKLRRGLVRTLDPTVGRYNRFLFDKMTRGLMSESIVREFERQFKPGMNPDAVLRDISRDINERFGNIGRQGVLKSKTAQDLARMFFLAPQWVEGMARTELRGAGRLSGASYLTGQRNGLAPLGATGSSMAKGLISMFVLTQGLNLITRGKPTWKNDEPGHWMDAWIPSMKFGAGFPFLHKDAKGDGFWFNPLSLFMELSHDLFRLGENLYQRNQPLGGAMTQILSNKLSPISRALLVMGGGYTPTGQKITSTSARFSPVTFRHGYPQFGEPLKAMSPLPITFGKYLQYGAHAAAPNLIKQVPKGQIQRQAIGTIGLKVEPALSRPAIIGRLADQFMRKNGLKKETGWEQVQTDEASYTKLRAAIRDKDDEKAKDIYQDLLKTRTEEDINKSMSLSYKRPFTGSNEAEQLFIQSLDDKQLQMYQAARERQMDEFEAFVNWLAKQP